jgi:signal transduction histidine kinase
VTLGPLSTGLARSFAVRVAALAAGLVVLVCLLGFGWGYLRVEEALSNQLDAAIAGQTEAFLEELDAGGLNGLTASVAAEARRRGAFVVLQTQRGTIVAGGIDAGPVGLRGFTTFRSPDGRSLRALGAILPGGLNLIVAADLAPVRNGAAALTGALPVAGGVAAVAALLLGFLVARRLERRLRAVSDAAAAVIAGDLTRRLPTAGSNDEFDRLTGTVNTVLARFEQLVEGLQATTTNIAHDLRSPLFRLRQLLEAASLRPRDAAQDAATIDNALTELDGVLATFSALLRIARVEAGIHGSGFAPVALSDLVAGMVETFEAVAEDAGQSLTADIAPGQHVDGDPALLRQLLANLIENALAHAQTDTPKGAAIRVALHAAATGPILTVADDGPGIPEAERERVTERFFRLDRSRHTPGTGLGLALVAAVARLHGAALELGDARPGLLVTLRFPRAGASTHQ